METVPAADLPLYAILAGLFGGLALFLLGLEHLTRGLQKAAGDSMRSILASLTRNRFVGVVTGTLVTAATQSSSVTTVLVVGLISGGVMTLGQAVGVIMGANIGSTVTAQLIAFKVTEAALPMVAVGFVMAFAPLKREAVKHWGAVLLGLGLVFLGMAVMSDGMRPLRGSPEFQDVLAALRNPLLGALAGAAFTALVQSSAATLGITIAMAAQGLIGLEAAIAVALGANIGTCVTAMLAAIGRPREAVRASVVHVLFNVIGVVIWLPFIPELSQLVRTIAPGSAEREIANAHTLFNVINVIVLIWFAGPLARLVMWLVPERPLAPEEEAVTPRYLDPALHATPTAALDAVRRELARVGARVRSMVAQALPAALQGSRPALEALARMDEAVDALYAAIVDYLRRLGAGTLTERQAVVYMQLMEAARGLESIGDLVETDIVAIGRGRLEQKVTVSDHTARRVGSLHAKVLDALDLTLEALAEDDAEKARKVIAMKPDVQDLVRKASSYGAARLLAHEPNRVNVYSREMEIIEEMRRVYYFCKRICRVLAEPTPAAAPLAEDRPAEAAE